MNHKIFNRIIIITLLILSVVFFILQFFIFHDLHEAGFLFFQDLMFLPIEILLVTFILDRIIHEREKQNRNEQLNIVIGAFYSEIGNDSISILNNYVSDTDKVTVWLDIKSSWNKNDFKNAAEKIRDFRFNAEFTKDDTNTLKNLMAGKKSYILEMFNNPNMLENNKITDMLWALYHLIDEIENRDEKETLPDTDLQHLSGDILRAYGLLLHEWILYMHHLKSKYPYLFSIAIRKNPFAKNSIIVK